MDRYPDNYPTIRDHVVKVTLPGEQSPREFIPRDQWEEVAAERGEFRRVLALISAWRLDSGVRDPALDRLLATVGEDYAQARAVASVIAGVREWGRAQSTDREGGR